MSCWISLFIRNFVLLSQILLLGLSGQFFFSAFTVGRGQPNTDPTPVDLKTQTALVVIIGLFT
jgi:hypothetical protein